jgi:hypothetical protein
VFRRRRALIDNWCYYSILFASGVDRLIVRYGDELECS